MKLLKPLLIYFAGVFSATLVMYWMSPDYGAARVYKRNVHLYVKAHIYCFEGILAEWAQQDSIYIPLDSIEEEYSRTCGIKIDSIIQ